MLATLATKLARHRVVWAEATSPVVAEAVAAEGATAAGATATTAVKPDP